jgi:hypothetical protein
MASVVITLEGIFVHDTSLAQMPIIAEQRFRDVIHSDSENVAD